MKKGSIAIIALVLVAIIGAVILYSGSSSPAAAGAVSAAAPPQQDSCTKCANADSNSINGVLTAKGVKACCTPKGGGNKPATCSPSQPIVCLTGLSSPCSATGISTCNSLTCTPDVGPQPEVCDNSDNDCNGAVDDGNPGGGGACNSGQLGACAAGTTNCNNGAIVCNANNAPVAEVCNSVDDDCDGNVDNGIPPVACMTIDGCAGTVSCEAGAAGPCRKTDPNCPSVTPTPTLATTPTTSPTPTSCSIICGPAGSVGPGNGCSTDETCSPDQCSCTPPTSSTPTGTPAVTETPSATGTPTDCVGATGACPGPAGQSCCEGLTCFAGQCGAP